MKKSKYSFSNLTLPLMLEMLLFTMLNNIDTLMLASYSDKAVAAIGSVGQVIFLTILFFQIISNGSGILIVQNLGARNKINAQNIIKISFILNLVLGVIISIILRKYTDNIILYLGFKDELYRIGVRFYKIIAMFSFVTALQLVNNSVLRSYGYAKLSVKINIFTNFINIIGNAIFIFGLFNAPILGEVGVAISTVFSQIIGLIITMYFIIKKLKIIEANKNINFISNSLDILRIGIPSAVESLLYNFGQLIIIKLIATLGDSALTARAYIVTIARFVMVISVGTGSASQIITGYLVGAKHYKYAKKIVNKIFLKTILSIFISTLIIIAFRKNILLIFTKDNDILNISIESIIAIVLLETGRSINMVYISAMKGAKDLIFPVIIGVISMWCIGVFGSYLAINIFKLGLLGTFIAISLDEWFRGIIMIYRWNKEKWIKTF
ncbi:MAG: hypothetical protein PWP46_531 [Fusobacteriaceae bacterium]|jgi:putative MATE family efflux protein|nr:family efflux transporter [Fusobacteriales bacterium]MDN5303652.1 hypothetical protein [Fusobacteriaceae bacterium]